MHAAVAPETLRPNRARTKMTEPVKKITAKMTEPVKKSTAKMTEPATSVRAAPWAACSRALAVGGSRPGISGDPRLDAWIPLVPFALASSRGSSRGARAPTLLGAPGLRGGFPELGGLAA